ncbi:hypothetical protein [Joostella sp. CR20]|uniref:hypothetical protein n=1 Tax=Joostella sp. CR20 TaxID=2804312 RepID=UPI00313BB7AF
MKKIILSSIALIFIAGSFISCKETEKEKEVITKEEPVIKETPKAPEKEEVAKPVTEKAPKKTEKEVEEEIDEAFEKFGDNN